VRGIIIRLVIITIIFIVVLILIVVRILILIVAIAASPTFETAVHLRGAVQGEAPA
jgi:hypothetical protein